MIRFFLFHLRAVVTAFVAAGLFESVVRFSDVWYSLGSVILFGVVVAVVCNRYVNIRMALWDMALILLAYIATIFLIILTEWRIVIVLLEVLGACTVGALVDILLSNTDTTPVYVKKAFRRIRVMSWVFICAAFFITAYAMSFFFAQIPLGVLFVFVGLLSAFCSYAIWRMYYQVPSARFTIWLIIMSVMSMELFWVIHLLPFGYVVLGFLLTWLWYLLLLLMRFHISSEGIRWKQQVRFLLMNEVVFIALLLFVIRWI